MLRNYVNPKLISKPTIRSCIYSFSHKRGISASGGREEGRAPSTEEEFTRQKVASQTVKKAYDGAATAENVSGESEEEVEKVKKEFEDKKDYDKKGSDDDDDDGLPINTDKGT